MNLFRLLQQSAADHKPLRVGRIGAGKFGAMYLAQAGAPDAWRGDVVATTKRALKAGETLDGEGWYTVYGRLRPARDSLALGGLPLGLAHRIKLKYPVAAHQSVAWADVELPEADPAIAVRREMAGAFR